MLTSNTNNRYTQRDVMEVNEVLVMPQDECILVIRGLKPFKDKKFDYTKHKNYQYTTDAKL